MQHNKKSFQNQNMFDTNIHPLAELNPLFSPEDTGFRNESEQADDHFHELEDYFSLQEDEQIDYSKANRLNDYYRVAQGWDAYIYEINDLLLVASGQSGMSLYGDDFTDAVVKWQLKNGFSGKNADGIIGPESWKRMQLQLPSFAVKPGTASPHSTAGVSASTISSINQYATIIDSISAKYGLDPAVTRGIIAAESGGNARSGSGSTGYKGLMQSERTTDQLNPDISIESGVKKFTEFQSKIFNPWLTKIGVSVSAINPDEYLKMCLSCYNAGPVTAMKAVQYAKLNGNINSWLQPENYLRALLFSGGYAAYDNCSKGKSDTEFDAAKKERLKYKFKTSGWRTEQDPPAWSSVSGSLNPILKCWIETKFRNTPGYLDKFINYYKYYQSQQTGTFFPGASPSPATSGGAMVPTPGLGTTSTSPLPATMQRKPLLASYLSVSENERKIKVNVSNLQKAGVSFSNLLSELNKYVDCNFIYNQMIVFNSQTTGTKYQINFPFSFIDATITEAIHQIQIYFYNDNNEHDGILGPSTIETLGFLKHGLRGSATALSEYKSVLKKFNQDISTSTNGEFNATNWFDHIIEPAFLGTKIERGVHVIFFRLLRKAENYLLALPKYAGLSHAELGKKLGIQTITGCRSYKAKQAMHAYGIAIDIDINTNPYLGAPWVEYDKVKLTEKYRMLEVLKKAANASLPGKHIFEYLHLIAVNHGKDSAKVFSVLKQNHDEFVQFVAANSPELRFWQNSATFDGKTAAKGFLSHHADLVFALRQIIKLAWGATDFGANASGDIMHFDMRTVDFGPKICSDIGGYVPKYGHHPAFESLASDEYEYEGQTVEPENYFSGEIENEDFDDSEFESNGENFASFTDSFTYYEEENSDSSLDKAVVANQKYSSSLGWNQFHDQINDLLLPFSGQSNVSLGEHDFAQAVAVWQRSQGFASKDCDGIIGPVTWRTMQMQIHAGNTPVVTPPSSTSAPGIQNILGFNQYYAGKILARMNQGILGSRFNSKLQLEAIAQGRSVLRVNPNSQIIQILPILYHIGEMAAQNNFREILIGSFIWDAASNGTCTGHCAGRCIDINHSHRDFADPRALQMVVNILGYLNSLPLQFKKFLGFGMPFQGSFFTNKRLPKFRKASPGDLADNQLKLLVPTLGIVFPDNDNHLHIQVKWI